MNRNKKILLSCDYFYPSTGGVEIFMEDLGIHLLKLGYKVEVSARWLPERKSDVRKGLKIHSFRCDGGLTSDGDEFERKKFYKLISDGGFDHVIMLTQPDNWVASALLHKVESYPPITLFPSINTLNVDEWSGLGMWNQVARVLKAADQIVAVTASGLDYVTMTDLELNPIYLPHAIDKDAAKTNFQKKYGLDPDRPLLVMVANFWPVKNHIELLRILSGTDEAWQIVIIGNPVSDKMSYFEEAQKVAALDERVRLIPGLPRHQAASAIRDADLLLIPSIGESAGPLVALQAMSYGTPWIATPNCNAVQDQAGGLSVDLNYFPEAINYVLNNKKVFSVLSQSGKKQWKDSFTWDKIAPAFDNLLRGNQIPDFRISEDLQNKKIQQQEDFQDFINKTGNRKESPTISVVIPTYNRLDILKKCLNAIANQSFPFDEMEVIVCDDGSTDDTQSYMSQVEMPFKLRYLRQENSGPAKARNMGIREASGEYLLILNDDAIMEPDNIRKHLETHDKFDQSVAVLGTFDLAPEHQKSLLGRIIQEKSLLFDYDIEPEGFADALHFYTCNISIRRDIIVAEGLFDETFEGPAAEDIDMGYRLYQKGIKTVFQPACVSFHDHPVTLDGFLKTQRVRGYGWVTLMQRHGTLNYFGDKSYAETKKWADNWKSQFEQMEQIRAKLNESGLLEQEVTQDLDYSGLYRHIKRMRDFYYVLGHIDNPGLFELTYDSPSRNQRLIPQKEEFKTAASLSSKVSIIIPVFNNLKLTRECLLSVFKNSEPDAFELIVVDNASTDGVTTYLTALSDVGKLTLIKNDHNQGFARACNQGAEVASGDILIFLNNDTEVQPGWMRGIIKNFQDVKNGIVGARLLYPDGSIQHAGIGFIGGIPDHPFRHCPGNDPDVMQMKELDMVTGACFAVRRDLFKELRGFDEIYRNGVEDVDLCLRVRDAGYKVIYEPEVVAFHYEGKSSGRFDHVNDNLTIFFQRWRDRFSKEGVFQPQKEPQCFPASKSVLKGSNSSRVGNTIAKPSVVWEGSQFVTHSLAHVNRSIGKQLLKKGFDLSLIPYEKDTFTPERGTEDYELYNRYGAPVQSDNHVHVRHQWPPNLTPPASGHWVIIQPWEFGSLPEKWVRPMSTLVDEIWVPTSYVKECYVRSGVPQDRVQVVPNGVDVDIFSPSAKPYALKTKKAFKFLFVGGTIGRKGIDVLLDTYVRNFKASDDVCLVIKDMGGKSFYRGQTAADSIAQLQVHPDTPEIEYIDHELTNDEMAGLYAACDCLVHPYRGEGFGLPIAEAMASGLPVIVTNHGAALDFCNHKNAFLINAREVKLKEKAIGNIVTVDHPWWAEPDSTSLAKFMKEVIKQPEEAKKRAINARKTILKSFTWDSVGEQVSHRIMEISKKPIRRLQTATSIKWNSRETFIEYFMRAVREQQWTVLEKETLRASKLYPDDTYIWVLRAINLRVLGQYDEAIEAVEKSLKIAETPEALHEAIQIAQASGKSEQADMLRKHLVIRFPEWAQKLSGQHAEVS